MILVLTGPVGSGKTTFLKELLAKLQALGVPASGYLSPAVLVDGEPSGYDLLLVQSGQLMVLHEPAPGDHDVADIAWISRIQYV